MSGLVLSDTVMLVGQEAELTAEVWLSAEVDPADAVVAVGPAEGVGGALTEQWAILEPVGVDGMYAATFTVPAADDTGGVLVRAEVTVADAVGRTPPLQVEWMAPWSDDEALEIIQRGLDAFAIFEAADPESDRLAAQTALVLWLVDQDWVSAVSEGDDGGYGVGWIDVDGIPYVLFDNPGGDGALGGRGTSELPALHIATSGPGVPRGSTTSSSGTSGRSRSAARTGTNVTGNARARVLSPFRSDLLALEAVYGTQNDYSDELATLMGATACPRVDHAYAEDAAASLAAFSDSLTAGLQAFVTHGGTYFGAVPKPARWNYPTTAGQVALATATDLTINNVTSVQVKVAAGQLAIAPLNTSYGKIAYLPPWVVAESAGNPIPNSIVVATACRSAYNTTMSSAYLSSGAGTYVGYSRTVSSEYTHPRGLGYWTELLTQRHDTTDAYAAMITPPDADTMAGAFPYSFGAADLYVHGGELANGDFESGTAGWSNTGPGEFGIGGSIPSIGGIGPAEGSQFGWMMVDADFSTTYEQFGQSACPAPGEEVTMTFKWRVVRTGYNSCAAGVPNWLNLRVDNADPPGNETVWSVGWDQVCPLMSEAGAVYATDWQDASVTFTAPDPPIPASEEYTFSIGGWDYVAWYGLIDDIQFP